MHYVIADLNCNYIVVFFHYLIAALMLIFTLSLKLTVFIIHDIVAVFTIYWVCCGVNKTSLSLAASIRPDSCLHYIVGVIWHDYHYQLLSVLIAVFTIS